MDYVKEAKALGFTQAALMPVSELVIVPEYRMFCEENLCGNYNVLPAWSARKRHGGGNDGARPAARNGARPHDRAYAEDPMDQTGAESRQAPSERADRAASCAHARKRRNRHAYDGCRSLEDGVVHVGLLRECAEDGRLCRYEVLGKRRENPLFLAHSFLG